MIPNKAETKAVYKSSFPRGARSTALYYQRGLTFWGFVWGAAFFIILTIGAVKAIPPYMNNHKINKGLHALIDEPGIQTMARRRMLRLLNRKLNIDYADDVVNLNKAFKVKKIKGQRQLSVNYEVVVPLAYNANFLFDFTNEVIVPPK
ncbi:MAG: DUF4845 domain-containing protein [Pseudomonadota bacterium]